MVRARVRDRHLGGTVMQVRVTIRDKTMVMVMVRAVVRDRVSDRVRVRVHGKA